MRRKFPRSFVLALAEVSRTACLLFEICFTLFLSRPIGNGTVVALDEAHKVSPSSPPSVPPLTSIRHQYMTATPAAERFTDSLLRAIRLQRHQGARVLISTQEPTISANLLSLCTFTLTHRFTSPAWLRFLKLHIAPASQEDPRDLMQKIVELDCGEALLFASNGLMVAPVRKMNGDVTDGIDLAGLEIGHGEEEEGVESRLREEEGAAGGEVEKFGMRYLKIKIRKRLTADGGQSVMAVR